MEIVDLGRDAVPFAAALHASSLPHGFFSRLGCGFLRAYYRTFVDSPHALALVATVDARPVGVVVGIVHTGEHRRWLVRHRLHRLVGRTLVGLCRHPSAARLFVRTRALRYGKAVWRLARRRSAVAQATGATSPAVLSHLAVTPAARGRGAGAALVRRFVQLVGERGAHRVELVTLAGAAGAADFYRALGWRHDGDRLDRDRRMVSDLSTSAPRTEMRPRSQVEV